MKSSGGVGVSFTHDNRDFGIRLRISERQRRQRRPFRFPTLAT